DQEMYSDGVKQWTYLKEDNECYVENLADAGDDFITPTKLLTIWEQGFKYEFDKETTVGGVVVESIKLYPIDPKKSQFHTVVLNIDKNKKQIQSAIIKAKSGVTITYILTKFETNLEIPDTIFKFDKTKHPGVVVIED
ncbi:MAG: LolA family protein, partial [Bacteroidia bacterium]